MPTHCQDRHAPPFEHENEPNPNITANYAGSVVKAIQHVNKINHKNKNKTEM